MILKNKEVLEEVIHEIMDDMFFLFPEIDGEGNALKKDVLDGPCVDVGIHFNHDDLIRIRVDQGILTEMTSNFTGLSPNEIDEEQLQSTATETANIIGGNLLVKIDPEQTYRLSIPEILDSDNALPLEKRPWQLSFISDSGGLLCWPEPLK